MFVSSQSGTVPGHPGRHSACPPPPPTYRCRVAGADSCANAAAFKASAASAAPRVFHTMLPPSFGLALLRFALLHLVQDPDGVSVVVAITDIAAPDLHVALRLAPHGQAAGDEVLHAAAPGGAGVRLLQARGNTGLGEVVGRLRVVDAALAVDHEAAADRIGGEEIRFSQPHLHGLAEARAGVSRIDRAEVREPELERPITAELQTEEQLADAAVVLALRLPGAVVLLGFGLTEGAAQIDAASDGLDRRLRLRGGDAGTGGEANAEYDCLGLVVLCHSYFPLVKEKRAASAALLAKCFFVIHANFEQQRQ